MGKFDLNTDTCGRGNFLIQKEKVADSKISKYVWMGPLFIYVIAKGVNITVKFVSIADSFGYVIFYVLFRCVINIYVLYLSCTNAQIKHAKKCFPLLSEAKGPDSYYAEHRFLELIDVSRLNTYTDSFKEMT